MSLKIIKAGILDSIQDTGRYGYQHQGINPGGAMDTYCASLANALLGKSLNAAVIEMHFPAAEIMFTVSTIFCLTGADFSPSINDVMIPNSQLIVAIAGSILKFHSLKSGARCYLSVVHEFEINRWLGSFSTNLKASAGGYKGRALKKDDVIAFKNNKDVQGLCKEQSVEVLPWGFYDHNNYDQINIRLLKGNEWDLLIEESKEAFLSNDFVITRQADRMGYRLEGGPLGVKERKSMISSSVVFGTIQLLPDSQLILLMADHQTIGGYPRVGHVITADLHLAAQKKPGDPIRFIFVSNEEALELLSKQQQELNNIRSLCESKLKEYMNATV